MWAERPKLYQGFFCPMSDRETTPKLVLNVFQLIYSLPSPCGKMHTFGYQQILKSFRLFGWAFYKLQGVFQQQEMCVPCMLCMLCSAAQSSSHQNSFSSADRGLEPSSDMSLALGLGLTVFADRVKHSIYFSIPKDLFPAALRHSESLYLSDWRWRKVSKLGCLIENCLTFL